ncbi:MULTISPECIES: RNA polymerase sigma factor [Bacillaceae]|uniref:RNA polymerase sigma factor n=1 Tax=Evansella alkalicola TaxID=745819 RepID=A0ABS6JY99_9BACI|nr:MULTISPECIES: RNA polymerase sigma factor [Bacillaceae]MBU9723559.1 RNA polymerase sigma factor [Bacillus alkalicola]
MSYGKKQEIETWFEEYSDPIFKYICMMTRDYQQAEDLTQETFIKAYRSMDSFERNASEKTWLFRIAHNVTIDYLRKQRPLQLFESFLSNKKDGNPLPEDVINMKESYREVYQAIGSLKNSYKEVIILRKIKGFSIEETSQILNWSETKVKVTLHRAMPILRKQLEKEGFLYEKTT